MSYKSLSEQLLNSPNLKPAEPVNEVLLTLIAASVLAFTCKPLLETDFFKSIGGGIGMMFGGIGSMFASGAKGKGKDDDDEKSGKSKDKDKDKGNSKDKDDDEKSDKDNDNGDSDSNKKDFNAMMQNMFAFCQGTIDKEKDKNKQESLNAMLDTVRAASVDKDGNPVDPEKMGERFKEITGKSPEDWVKDNGVEMPSKEEIEKIQDAAKKDIENKSPEERKKIAEDGVVKAKAAGEKITKAREELEKAQKELDELKDAAKNESDPEKKKGLVDKIKDAANNVLDKTKALAGSATGKTEVEQATSQAEEAGSSEGAGEQNSGDNSTDGDTPGKTDVDDAVKQSEKAVADADAAVETAQKALDEAPDDKKEELQKALDDAKEKQKAAKDESDKHKDNKEEVFQVTHNGKPDKIIKRKKLRGEGHVYCYASDKKTTISPDVAKDLIKKSSGGANESLASYLIRRLG